MRSRIRRAVLQVALAGALAVLARGCGETTAGTCVDKGTCAPSYGDGGGTDGSAVDVALESPGPSCGTAGEACVAAAPHGWTGPVVRGTGSGAPPACPAAYPSLAVDAHDGLSAGQAVCGCSCGDLTDACEVTVTVSTKADCSA